MNRMNYLTHEQYESKEKLFRSRLSNIFLKNFSPITYMKNGFPIYTDYEQELVRYIDSQHVLCLDEYFNNDCKGLTEQELLDVSDLTKKIYDFTKEQYGQEFLVKAPIVDSVFILRWIKAISSDNNMRITEIGAGSGMLGAMLLNCGYRYNCIDVTQPFYLIQNRIFSQFASSMDELVTDDLKDSQCVHIPYWRLWDLKDDVIETDIFTCNHALLETPKKAILFYIKLAKKWMVHSKVGIFLIRSWGWETMYKKADAIKLFLDEGFDLIYMDNETNMALFALNPDSRKLEIDIEEVMKNGFYQDGKGEEISKKQRLLNKSKTMSDLCAIYDSITLNQVSPDEEFHEFLGRDI